MHNPVCTSQNLGVFGRFGVKIGNLELQDWWGIDGSAIFAIWSCSCCAWLLPYVELTTMGPAIGTFLWKVRS